MIGSHIFGIPVEENLPYIIPILPAAALWFKMKFGKYGECKCEGGECQCHTETSMKKKTEESQV